MCAGGRFNRCIPSWLASLTRQLLSSPPLLLLFPSSQQPLAAVLLYHPLLGSVHLANICRCAPCILIVSISHIFAQNRPFNVPLLDLAIHSHGHWDYHPRSPPFHSKGCGPATRYPASNPPSTWHPTWKLLLRWIESKGGAPWRCSLPYLHIQRRNLYLVPAARPSAPNQPVSLSSNNPARIMAGLTQVSLQINQNLLSLPRSLASSARLQ